MRALLMVVPLVSCSTVPRPESAEVAALRQRVAELEADCAIAPRIVATTAAQHSAVVSAMDDAVGLGATTLTIEPMAPSGTMTCWEPVALRDAPDRDSAIRQWPRPQ